MMKRIFYALLSLTLLTFTNPQTAKASHCASIDMTVNCLGGGLYEIRLRFYRDCAGISAPSTWTVKISAPSLGYTPPTAYTTIICNLVSSTSGQDITAHAAGLCPPNGTNCSGTGSFPGYEEYNYVGTVNLSGAPGGGIAGDWTFWTQPVSARNAAITNLYNPGGQAIYCETVMDNTVVACDSTPSYGQVPLAYACMCMPFTYNHAAIDPNGDSLVYTLIPPQSNYNVSIPYGDGSTVVGAPGVCGEGFPYTATYPMSTSAANGTGFGFNPLTGQIYFIPCCTANQFGIVTLRIDFYRNGLLIGHTMRDLQIITQNCSNNPPHFNNSGYYNVTGGNMIDTLNIVVCPNTTLTFDLQGQDPDVTDSIFIVTNLGTVIPTLTYSISGNPAGGGPLTLSASWTPTAAQAGFYVFLVTVKDNACPVIGQVIYAFVINVPQSTNAGPDQTICVGDTVQLGATGGTTFSWSPPLYLDDSTLTNPISVPLADITYTVTSDMSALCNNTDQVTIHVAQPINFISVFGNPAALCSGQSTTLGATFSGGIGSPTFQWSTIPSSAFSSTLSAPTDAPLVTTTYQVVVTDVCIDSSTVTIPVGTPVIAGPDTTVCQDFSIVQLFASGPNTYDWAPAATLSNANIANPIATPSTTTTYTVTGNLGSTCQTTATVTVTVEPHINLAMTATPDTICAGNPVNLSAGLTGGLPPITYSWTSNPGVWTSSLPSPTVNPLVTTMYYLTANNLCTNNDSVLVTIKSPWTPDFTITDSVCTGQSATAQYIGNAPGGTTFTWSASGGGNIVGGGAGPVQISWGSSGPKTVTLQVSQGGCVSDTTMPVFVKQQPNSSFTATTPICIYDNSTVTFTGTPSDTYTWGFGSASVISGSGGGPYVIHYSNTGTFQVTLTVINNGCSSTITTQSILVNPQPAPDFTVVPTVGCDPLTVQFTNTTVNGTTYNWDFGDGQTSTLTNPTHTYTNPGVYNVQLDAHQAGCNGTITKSNLITVIPHVIAGFNMSIDALHDWFMEVDLVQQNPNLHDPTGAPGVPFTFHNTSTNGTNYTWIWGDNTYTNVGDTSSQTHYYNGVGLYTVGLAACNQFCCDTIWIGVIDIVSYNQIYIPNVFSPNADGYNDYFHVLGKGIQHLDISIYDRWGELVWTYSGNDVCPGVPCPAVGSSWDGKHKGKDAEVGVYVYKVKAIMYSGEVVDKQGNLTLVR